MSTVIFHTRDNRTLMCALGDGDRFAIAHAVDAFLAGRTGPVAPDHRRTIPLNLEDLDRIEVTR